MSIENPQNSGESPNTLYSADDILSTTTNSQIHKKPLQNAESMLKKGNIKSALEIYARVLQRIKEPEAHRKIKEIIDQISSSSNVNETLLQPKVLPSSRGDQKLNFTKENPENIFFDKNIFKEDDKENNILNNINLFFKNTDNNKNQFKLLNKPKSTKTD